MIKLNSKFVWHEKYGPSGTRKRKELAHAALDSQIKKDVKLYVPRKGGDLSASVERSPEVGLLVWNMRYARRMFHGLHYKFSKAFHPFAGPQWIERSKAVWLPKWKEVVRKIFKGHV